MTEALLQGTDEWRLARAGSLGASQLADALRRTKTGWGASRANLMADLLVERLTGKPTAHYESEAMRWGTATEPDARAEYEFQKDVEVTQIGLVRHPKIVGTHASPDGLVGADGLVEFKCPMTATHIETLLYGSVPGEYVTQCMWQMACLPDRKWCDFVSFDPRLPQRLRMFCKRIERDDIYIDQLEHQAQDFLTELEIRIADLTRLYPTEIAA